MMREKVLLQGNFWILPVSRASGLDFSFLSEFFEVSLEEVFDEEKECIRKFLILKKKRKFLGLTN